MSNLPEARIKILQQFCDILENGLLLGTQVTDDEIINIHKVGAQYAIVYYSLDESIIYDIKWQESLNRQEEEIINLRYVNRSIRSLL